MSPDRWMRQPLTRNGAPIGCKQDPERRALDREGGFRGQVQPALIASTEESAVAELHAAAGSCGFGCGIG